MSLDTNLSEFTAFDSDTDHPHDECGVFGVWAPDRDVARLTYFGLRALQHRGQESAGIAVGDGGTVMVRKDLGLVSRVFSNADICSLPGQLAVGHVRYGTAGAKSWEASQPHLATIGEVIVALAHNGTLVNTDELRRQLIELGVPFNSNSDSEVAVKLIGYFTQETHHLREGIRKTMELIRGGYAMALINEEALYAFRDPHGVRPLVLGRRTSDEGLAAAEAAAAAGANPFTDALAEAAYALAYRALPRAYQGDRAAKAEMLYASCMAGIAFNAAGLGVCHSMAHALGGRFHVAHGRLNARLLPQGVAFHAADARASEKYARLARRCGLAAHPRALSAALVRLRTGLGIPARLDLPPAQLKAALPALSAAALADVCLPGNPRPVTAADVEAMMEALV